MKKLINKELNSIAGGLSVEEYAILAGIYQDTGNMGLVLGGLNTGILEPRNQRGADVSSVAHLYANINKG